MFSVLHIFCLFFFAPLSIIYLLYIYFYIPWMCEITHCYFFSFWLILLSMIFSMSIHIVANGNYFIVCVWLDRVSMYIFIDRHKFIYLYIYIASYISFEYIWWFRDSHVWMLSHFSHVWFCDPMDCSLPGSPAFLPTEPPRKLYICMLLLLNRDSRVQLCATP